MTVKRKCNWECTWLSWARRHQTRERVMLASRVNHPRLPLVSMPTALLPCRHKVLPQRASATGEELQHLSYKDPSSAATNIRRYRSDLQLSGGPVWAWSVAIRAPGNALLKPTYSLLSASDNPPTSECRQFARYWLTRLRRLLLEHARTL